MSSSLISFPVYTTSLLDCDIIRCIFFVDEFVDYTSAFVVRAFVTARYCRARYCPARFCYCALLFARFCRRGFVPRAFVGSPKTGFILHSARG